MNSANVSVLFLGIFWGGGGGNSPHPPQKLTISPQMAAKLCALNLLLAGTLKLSFNEQKTKEITNHWAIKPFKFMPKMHQNMCGRRALPGTTEELMRSPRPHSRNGGLLRRGKERAYLWGDGEKGRGLALLTGTGDPGGKVAEKVGKGIPPPEVKVSRINTGL